MSGGGPPHHPHNRHVPPSNSAWNHLPVSMYRQNSNNYNILSDVKVPGYFPRQPQVAHLQPDHPLHHQPTWHTPITTTEAMKLIPHPQMLSEMFKNDARFPRDCVDLSLTRNGNQNGEPPPHVPTPTAISLSVRDANKINSLPPSMLEIQAVELTKCGKSAVSPGSLRSTSVSPGLKAASPGLLAGGIGAAKSLSPGLKSISPGPLVSSSPCLTIASGLIASATQMDGIKNQKRSNVRVDSILERLNPIPEKTFPIEATVPPATVISDKSQQNDKLLGHSVIVQPAPNSFDENSNSSAATPKEDDSTSVNSNEDSLDSTKSRRKRKPSKTIRVNKDEETKAEPEEISHKTPSPDIVNHKIEERTALVVDNVPKPPPEESDSSSTPDEVDGMIPAKSRRKSSSEQETIDNIAAMVQEGLKKDNVVVADSDTSEVKKLVDEETVETQCEIKQSNTCANGSSPTALTPNLTVVLEKTDLISTPLKDVEKENNLSDTGTMISHVSESEPMENVDESVNCVTNVESEATENLQHPGATVSVIKSKEILEDTLESGGKTTTPEIAIPTPVATPAQKKASITHFVDVENKLEEMFAGIVEDGTGIEPKVEPIKNDSIDLVAECAMKDKLKEEDEQILALVKVEKKTTPKKVVRNRPSSKSDQEGETPTKKKKLYKKTTSSKKLLGSFSKTKKPSSVTSQKVQAKVVNNVEAIKDVYQYDSGSNASSNRSRGPFVQIRGPRDSPVSVSVVNTPLGGDEETEKKTIKGKKFHDDSEYRHKVRSKGLHCSTLSNKYDADRKDATWICAFCKRGPHASELSGPSVVLSGIPSPGDLFGPYFITTRCPEFEKRLDDPYDRQFKSRKIHKALDAAAVASTSKSAKKTKRKLESLSNPDDIWLGITATTNGETYEVWLHEDCMVWSAGVYLVGPKIAGLEEAVWNCSNVSCGTCGLRGANVICVKRGCLSSSHVSCARKSNWRLDEDEFKAYCPEHWR